VVHLAQRQWISGRWWFRQRQTSPAG
jgi:hypothetical protein